MMGLEVLLLLIPVSFLLALLALGLFLWANQSGQFDDLETPAIRIFLDDAPEVDTARPGVAEPSAPAPMDQTATADLIAVHPNTAYPNTVHPNTVHPNTVHPKKL